MAARVSISRDELIPERLLQYSSNPQKVRIILSELLRWAEKKPDIQMQTSLMTSEESRYADILIAQGAQRKHLAKELKFSKLILKGLGAERLALDAHQRWMHASQKTVFNSLCSLFHKPSA